MIEVTRSKLLLDNQVKHGFTKRNGDLNTKLSKLTYGQIEDIASNIELIIKSEEMKTPLVYLYLAGGSDIALIDQSVDGSLTILDADGVITNQDISISITVADCLPVLITDKKAGVSGISHGGWKGSADRLTTKVIKSMVEIGANPEDMIAAIGPSICAKCYEVGNEVAEQFSEEYIDYRSYEKPHLDLWAANESELRNAGIESIDNLRICTFENHHEFYSARHDVQTGRFLAYISNTAQIS